MNESLEERLCPWGGPAMLFQDYRDHALFQPIEVKPLLAVCAAFSKFFSEKVSSYWLFDVCSMDAHIDPYL